MIPAHIKNDLDNYRDGNHPYEFGSFVTAVLANDLVGAVSRADSTNIKLLPEYAEYLRTLPRDMWGSYEIVEREILKQREFLNGSGTDV